MFYMTYYICRPSEKLKKKKISDFFVAIYGLELCKYVLIYGICNFAYLSEKQKKNYVLYDILHICKVQVHILQHKNPNFFVVY